MIRGKKKKQNRVGWWCIERVSRRLRVGNNAQSRAGAFVTAKLTKEIEEGENKMSEAARSVPAKEVSPSKPGTFTAKAYAAPSPTGRMEPFTVARRSPRPQDVQIEILF